MLLPRLWLRWLAIGLLSLTTTSSVSQSIKPLPKPAAPAVSDPGWIAVNRRPDELLAEHRRVSVALASLKKQRPELVDAYVIVAALDADPVFQREAKEVAKVLERRYDAAGRTLLLAAGEGGAGVPGSPAHLALSLARVAELMDKKQDALVLYTTSHGTREGLAYKDAARGFGTIAPGRLASILGQLGLGNRLVMLSACYSGVFVPSLSSDTSVVVTAAAADRTSFGCAPGNDWTFFGDALINRALRKPQTLRPAFAEAAALLTEWEARQKLGSSNPQLNVGKHAEGWLSALEKRVPTQRTQPVGRSPAAGAGAH